MTFIVPFPGGQNVLQKTFRGQQLSPAVQASYTFPGFNFGIASADRIGVLFASWSGNIAVVDIGSATIGGVAATQRGSSIFAGGVNRSAVAMFTAPLPSGSSGSVVININGNSSYGSVFLYTMTGSPSPVLSLTGSTAGNPNATKDIPAGGLAFGAACCQGNSGSAVWSGLTEDDENATGVFRIGAASRASAVLLPSVAMSCTFGVGPSAGLFATFAPP